jgi:hypothetical protein
MAAGFAGGAAGGAVGGAAGGAGLAQPNAKPTIATNAIAITTNLGIDLHISFNLLFYFSFPLS